MPTAGPGCRAISKLTATSFTADDTGSPGSGSASQTAPSRKAPFARAWKLCRTICLSAEREGDGKDKRPRHPLTAEAVVGTARDVLAKRRADSKFKRPNFPSDPLSDPDTSRKREGAIRGRRGGTAMFSRLVHRVLSRWILSIHFPSCEIIESR